MRKPYPNLTDPVVANLRFFIGIRNKIEHRYWDSSSLDILLFGECQALLFNYESFLVTLFGEDYSINTCLAYALQFSHLRAKEQLQAQRDLLSKDMLDIKNTSISTKQISPRKSMIVRNIASNYCKFPKSAIPIVMIWQLNLCTGIALVRKIELTIRESAP
mgnify:CR=1 FL=1